MQRVGVVLDPTEHIVKCWACRWVYEGCHRPGRATDLSVRIYEECVEAIEATTGTFTRPALWRQMGYGPTRYSILGRVLHDMRMHGLVVGVRFGANGRRIEAWEVNRR